MLQCTKKMKIGQVPYEPSSCFLWATPENIDSEKHTPETAELSLVGITCPKLVTFFEPNTHKTMHAAEMCLHVLTALCTPGVGRLFSFEIESIVAIEMARFAKQLVNRSLSASPNLQVRPLVSTCLGIAYKILVSAHGDSTNLIPNVGGSYCIAEGSDPGCPLLYISTMTVAEIRECISTECPRVQSRAQHQYRLNGGKRGQRCCVSAIKNLRVNIDGTCGGPIVFPTSDESTRHLLEALLMQGSRRKFICLESRILHLLKFNLRLSDVSRTT